MRRSLAKRISGGIFPIAVLLLLLFFSLYLMNRATQNSEDFNSIYSWVLAVNVLAAVPLIVLIGVNMARLFQQHRAKVTGSRLTLRLVALFVILAFAPVAMVYYFSLDFLRRGIDSWFDVRFDVTMKNTLELARVTLDSHTSELVRRTRTISGELAGKSAGQATALLSGLGERQGAELALFTADGQLLAAGPGPMRPFFFLSDTALGRVRGDGTYSALDRIAGAGSHIRVAVLVPSAERWVLQALYPVDKRFDELTGEVESSYARYEQLVYLRDPLKASFTLTLSLVLLLSLLIAVWAAFTFARRLVEPIRTLAIGTRAVAAGDYTQQLPLPSQDEFGVLVQSFNDMTQKIAAAGEVARRSQQRAENQRAYLETVLSRLSSGVLALDAGRRLRTANAAAGHILRAELAPHLGCSLPELARAHPHLEGFAEELEAHFARHDREWREEITTFGATGRQVLICGAASLPALDEGGEAGYVIVLDDVTALIQAQRDAAWGEMARRLAHEIKNPLTPIQLSAERLRHKYLRQLAPQDAELLDRSTHTIIQQVETMKEMVKAFSEYARPPKLERRSLDLNKLVDEVLDLYRGHVRAGLEVDLAPRLPRIAADAGRLRQLLHNLIKNALEAAGDMPEARIAVGTRQVEDGGFPSVELRVRDNGPGFPVELLDRVFEPYVTTKPKGSGLGLAIVKKIVEEHLGLLAVENSAGGGACVTVRLPIDSEEPS